MRIHTKTASLPFCLVALMSCSAQSYDPMQACTAIITQQRDTILTPDICPQIVRRLASGEKLFQILDSGEFTVVTPDGTLGQLSLPERLTSSLLMEQLRHMAKELQDLQTRNPGNAGGMGAALLADCRKQWADARDRFCSLHPGETFLNLSAEIGVCPGPNGAAAPAAIVPVAPAPTSAPATSSLSPHNCHDFHWLQSASVEQLQACGRKEYALAPVAVVPSASGCRKAITFAHLQGKSLQYGTPIVSAKWLGKIVRKYPDVCFPQSEGQTGTHNYLVVLAASDSAFSGLQPVYRTDTTVTPVSGSGTVTSNTEAVWYVTYQGTVTTTTTSQVNVPYTDRTTEFFANAYGEAGDLVARSERTSSSRSGGDPYNALGYNLTSALLSIHLKEHLLEAIISNVHALP